MINQGMAFFSYFRNSLNNWNVTMKKFLAFSAAILFVGALSVLAFTDDDPKKQKTETTTTEQCDKHKDAATGTADAKPCCKDAAEKSSAGCTKSADCKQHSEKSDNVN